MRPGHRPARGVRWVERVSAWTLWRCASSAVALPGMGCGASRQSAIEERYRIQMRDLEEEINPRLKQIRLADQTVADLWQRVDYNGNGTLEAPEIAMILVDIGHPLASNQIQALMDEIDVDKSGTIGRVEFVEWYKDSVKNDWKNLPVAVPKGQVDLPLYMRVLTQVPVFAVALVSHVPRHKEFCQELAPLCTATVFGPGEALILKDDDGDFMVLIVDGTCNILLSNEPDASPVDSVGAGDIVGESSVFTNQKRTACVRAVSETRALVLTRAAVDSVLPKFPSVKNSIEAFHDGRLDGFQKMTVEERRMAAQRRARTANKDYGSKVFEELFIDLQSGSLEQSKGESGMAAGDVSVDDPSFIETPTNPPDSTSKPGIDDRLHQVRSVLLTPTPAERLPPVPPVPSPLKQALMHPNLTPRSEALRHSFEAGVSELSSQLLDLSASVSDIVPSLSVESSRASLNDSTASAAHARRPNAEMMDALEGLLLKSKDQIEQRMDGKLRRVEKSCYRLADTFKSTFNEELAEKQALSDVENWLDERGLGRSSESANCTDVIISQLRDAQYKPREWLPLLEVLTQEQLMVLAEEAAWQLEKRKRRMQREQQRKDLERLMESGTLRQSSNVIVRGIDETGGQYSHIDGLRALFEEFGVLKNVQVIPDEGGLKSHAVITFKQYRDAKAALTAFETGSLPSSLTIEVSDWQTEQTRHMSTGMKLWRKLRFMWRAGIMIPMFISGAQTSSEARKKFEREQAEARQAKEEAERELQEAHQARKQAEKEMAEAREAAQVAAREQAEMEMAERDVEHTEAQVNQAEKAGLSIAQVSQLKDILAKKRKILQKETQEANDARRRAEQERAEAQEAKEKFNQEDMEARQARLRAEKEQREAELVMRLHNRTKRSSADAPVDSVAEARHFELPPETAVLQLERNLQNYRRNAMNSMSLSDMAGTADEDKCEKETMLTESQVTANILDSLSHSLMRLDPPNVVMATLRAAEAQLIRSRLTFQPNVVDDEAAANRRKKGLAAFAQVQVTELGAAGHAQVLWRETFSRAATKQADTVHRVFAD